MQKILVILLSITILNADNHWSNISDEISYIENKILIVDQRNIKQTCLTYKKEVIRFLYKINNVKSYELQNRYLEISNQFLKKYDTCVNDSLKNKVYKGYRINPLISDDNHIR